jgi:antitoxin component of RelBE/YafQ-DinJ toxin-antitoxin module
VSVVISVRISEEIKKILEKSGIDIGEEVRGLLEKLAWKIKIRKFVERWDELLKDVKPSEEGFSAKSVREDRESH